ncbi:MAG: sulfatase [Kiritimatiellia bacterium]|jgi:arylsulfatase A
MKFLTLFVVLASALISQAKPNFIIIFTDDQGYADLSCFGSENIKTPHIDRMAQEGRKFTSFYVASSICTPSRAALLTGCYPQRIQMAKGVLFPHTTHGLHPDEVTIADMLKSAGYATAAIGKWHLGHKPPLLPTYQGFDSYFGIPYSNDMKHPDNKNRPEKPWDKSWLEPDEMIVKWNTPLMRDEQIIECPVDQRLITRRYTDEAIRFVEKNQQNPFFLYLAHSMPHIPLFVPDEIRDPDIKNAYKNVIEHIDTETGRLLDTVRKLGLAENTYVVFTSDNGPWTQFKHHAGKATPLRGRKADCFEGGFRVPCVMWAPGRIPAGTETDEIASTIDLLPSFAKLAGIEPKTRGPIDGKDLSDLMLGTGPTKRTEVLFYTPQGAICGYRQGDYKLVRNRPNQPLELFNLKTDIREQKNLMTTRPEKAAELKARMTALDTQLLAEMRPHGTFATTEK